MCFLPTLILPKDFGHCWNGKYQFLRVCCQEIGIFSIMTYEMKCLALSQSETDLSIKRLLPRVL